MKVSFKSLDSDKNEITFVSDAHYENEYLVFEDSVVPDTLIYLKASQNEIELTRKGAINMKLLLKMGEDSVLKYKEETLFFELTTKTNEIAIKEDEIYFDYDLFDDIYCVGNHKIWIKINNAWKKFIF